MMDDFEKRVMMVMIVLPMIIVMTFIMVMTLRIIMVTSHQAASLPLLTIT